MAWELVTPGTVARFDSLPGNMSYKTLLKKAVKVYGCFFCVELREHVRAGRPSYYQLVDVFENCEHDRGIPYDTLPDAIRGFEAATGCKLTEEMKQYLEEK